MTLKLVKNTRTTSLANELMSSPRFLMFIRKLAGAQAIAEAGEQIKRTAATRRVAAENRDKRRKRNSKRIPPT